MERIGAYLKNGRTAKGLSREDISRITKIPLKFVTALEEESFSDLPQEVFVRGFVRTYCKEVDLAPDPVLGRLNEVLVPEPTMQIHEEGPALGLANIQGGSGKKRSRMGIALVLLFFVLGLLFGIITLTRTPGVQDMSQVTSPTHIDYPATVKTGAEDTGRYFF